MRAGNMVKPLEVGDRVELLKALGYDKLNGLKAGFKGVVIETEAHQPRYCRSLCTAKVKFDNWKEGSGPEFDEWWVAYHNLKIIP